MRKFLLCLLIFGAGFLTGIQAQDNYYNAVGIRAGNPAGVSYKHFIGRYAALEGIAGVNYSYKNPKRIGASVTALYEYHFFIQYYFNFYLGAGLTGGGGKGYGIFNIDALAALEYTFPNFPLTVSVDYKPYYSVADRTIGKKGFGFNEFGLTVRYVIQ